LVLRRYPRAQVLFTSHNTTLMDLDILRRDEIWLVALDEHQASTLSTVLRSSPRKGAVIGKAYLRGNYGAIPAIRNDMMLLSTNPKNKPTPLIGKAREAS
jgi:AAA15 family ATPase/GTPase